MTIQLEPDRSGLIRGRLIGPPSIGEVKVLDSTDRGQLVHDLKVAGIWYGAAFDVEPVWAGVEEV